MVASAIDPTLEKYFAPCTGGSILDEYAHSDTLDCMELLTEEQMIIRLLIALAVGIIMGLERELSHRDAGIKTSMLVAGGSCLFTLIALQLPYALTGTIEGAADFVRANGQIDRIIASVVSGVGFIGGGIILKNTQHVRGLTTASIIWATAAIGILVGIGLWKFALIAALIITLTVYFLRASGISDHTGRYTTMAESE